VRILRGLGYNVLEAANGDDAQRLFAQRTGDEIHLLLTDMVMPQMSGRFFADWLRKVSPRTKVVFVSGYLEEMLQPRDKIDIGMFFLLSGILQLFWVIPMIRRWGRPWYYFGLGGTVVLIIIWVMTRVPNPITNGRALPINSMSIITELFEIAFIIITAIIISKERSKRAPEIKQDVRRE